ncbi:MAG TPA: peptidoglycan bridge formation glycyltransferase FemA/FemB family protein [Candidatus Levybacteria bacterium]|nr:peptidoglycan bridge formation glycyltransferase FemA/FemB family protein [Candidatus Levybacteria bacterium]
MFTDITNNYKEEYNKAVTHPLQSYEWGEFRKSTGVKIVRRGEIGEKKNITNCYTMTIHKIPKLPYTIGYLPKGNLPNTKLLADIAEQAKKHNCIYIQLEPNITASAGTFEIEQLILNENIPLKYSFRPLFTKYSFVLDLTPGEESLLSGMHPKTRYNIKIALKHNVEIKEDNSEKGFLSFLKLYEETTTRQKFYAHTRSYHRKLWEELSKKTSALSYHLFHASVNVDETEKILTSWVLFSFHDTLYYPYGASSREHREMMANNLIMWEAIRFGKKEKLKKFDMWGALNPDPNTKDPWYGFHKFKQGYGATLTEYVGSYDLIINPVMYEFIKVADKVRWSLLSLKKKL